MTAGTEGEPVLARITLLFAFVKHMGTVGEPGGRRLPAPPAHSFCATQGLGHVSVALYLTVAQELAYGPNSFASLGDGRIRLRRRDRRMHADVSARIAGAQHLTGAAQHWGCIPCGAARQHQSATYELGDATEPDDESGRDGTESERRLLEQCDGRDRLDEGEDALTG